LVKAAVLVVVLLETVPSPLLLPVALLEAVEHPRCTASDVHTRLE
jgi:hypothetical protein